MIQLPQTRTFERIRFRGQPAANPENIVQREQIRFSLLTDRLIRMEWSADGLFEDRSTYAFPTRYTSPVPFTLKEEGNRLSIATASFTLTYIVGGGEFSPENLKIIFQDGMEAVEWRPGMPNPGNLRGTRRTLDNCDRESSLAEGLLSRDGWALFDDSRSVVFTDNGWVTPRTPGARQDWYFVCYGHDFKAALEDYTRFGGSIPMIPRFVLGAWWSRYWAYSEQDLRELVQEFEAKGLPLDVLVIDMDWHTPHAWTGYTWNRELFPDPRGFLAWVHSKGLKTTLNLHPAQGIQHFEEIYPEFAKAIGLDPSTLQPAQFRITDPTFVQAYFELIHHRMEDEGVDFWWLDWQQGEASEMPGLDPLPWINHLHFTDATRRGNRPLIYSRWGGLGNHRYPIGFSGDTIVGWKALQFQPYFTATASNVLFSWWSHDIGGHQGGETEPELYARWVQFGALSPCLRLHASKDARCERRPWVYPPAVFAAAKQAFHLRYQLEPYLYTMARRTFESGIGLCRPMYYEYPEREEAYFARYQYYLGDQMIAAPIVFPADPQSGLAAIDVWIPEGEWIDVETLELLRGPDWVRLTGGLERVPRLVKAGAILPLAAGFIPTEQTIQSGTTDTIDRERLVLSIFPGASGSFTLYEDDGSTNDYLQGSFRQTKIMNQMANSSSWQIEITPAEGDFTGAVDQRAYEIHLEGSRAPDTVSLNGERIDGWKYDPAKLRTTIPLPHLPVGLAIRVEVIAQGVLSALGQDRNQEHIRASTAVLLGLDSGKLPEKDEELIAAVLESSHPARANALARLGGPFLHFEEYVTSEDASQQLGIVIIGKSANGLPAAGEPVDLEVDFTLYKEGQAPKTYHMSFPGLQSSKILKTPFAFSGKPASSFWEARARLSYMGKQWEETFRSSVLFPAIRMWKILMADPLNQANREAVFTPEGEVNSSLPWQIRRANIEDLPNLAYPFGINLAGEFQEAYRDQRKGEAYLWSEVTSPETFDGLLAFQGNGEVDFTINGEKVTAFPEELPPGKSYYPGLGMFPAPRVIPFHFQAGANSIVVHSISDENWIGGWYFGAALMGKDGNWPDPLTFPEI